MGNARGPSLTGRYVILILLLAGLVTTFAVPAREWFWQKSRIADLEQTVSQRQGAIAELTAEEKRWQDPVYVAAQVRERLHFVRPGEVGYVVLTEQDVPAHTLPGHEAQRQGPKPWWTTMWNSVKDASAPSPAPAVSGPGIPKPASPGPASPAPASSGLSSPAPATSPSPAAR